MKPKDKAATTMGAPVPSAGKGPTRGTNAQRMPVMKKTNVRYKPKKGGL